MKRFPAVRMLALLCCLMPLHSQIVTAADIDYAMQIPGAETSMLLDVAVAGARVVAVGERGHILVSEDAGASWRQVEVPTSAMLTRVFFLDDSLGWAVGHDGNILHSQDGGLTWVLQRDGLADQVQINEQRAGRAQSRVQALQAQLAVASEELAADLEDALADAEWALENARETMDKPIYAPPLMDVWFATPEQGWAAGAYGTLLRTANGGRDWADWSHQLDNPEELHLNGVAGDGRGALYLASEWGMVFFSDNAGGSWQTLETGYDGSFFGVVINPASGSAFVYGLLGTIYRSQDQGETWEPVDSRVSASLFGADAAGDGVIFVGQGGTAAISGDDGDSFTPMIQPNRDGLFGVAALEDGHYVVTGEGGSRRLQGPGTGGQGDE